MRVVEMPDGRVVICDGKEVVITDGQSALDFIASVAYEYECNKIVVNKEAICEDFFDLSTGIAGDVAQKFVNYHIRFAIMGDFSEHDSKSLKDYIFECNKRGPLYFVGGEEEALKKL
ncbi:MAG: DUF4180 domain-containing protein [Defluviitaleaceae bacterium]|nr:DUF4180 domain-containing protein [Defluviitaleaceae bacterium]